MTTYTIILPDDMRLSSIHRFSPSSGNLPHDWSVSVRPADEHPEAGFCYGTARDPDLQHAANKAVAACLESISVVRGQKASFIPKTFIDLDLDL